MLRTLLNNKQKNRSNIAASILSNPETLKAAYESSKNAEGSALEENEKFLDSIQGKTQQFTNEVQEFWYNLINSDFVKGVVDAGTTVMDVIGNITEKIGGLGTVLGIGAGAVGIKSFIKNFGNSNEFALYGCKSINA